MVVPVVGGCCPTSPRCRLCNPAPSLCAPETIAALVESYRTERAAPDAPLVVGFFGGAPPSPAQVEAAGGLPLRVRVRPDLLDRSTAKRLAESGTERIELDALSFSRAGLLGVGRTYSPKLVLTQAEGIRALGLQVGVVLAPGLPGTSHADAVDDARLAAGRFDTARLHPVLVMDRSSLRDAHEDGLYTPLSLGEAVTVCRDMVRELQAGGTEVIRVGVQKSDGAGRAVAGPAHPALRQLVEARDALERLREATHDVPRGAAVTLRVARSDETTVRGPFNQHVRTLRAEGGLRSLQVVGDPTLPRGTLHVEVDGD